MKLVLLGTGGFTPTEQAQTACFMLPEMGILLDAGTGLYRASSHLQTPDLDIYLSHAHGDHTSGLTYLFSAYFLDEINTLTQEVNEHTPAVAVEQANRRMHATRVHATQTALVELTPKFAPSQFDWRVLQTEERLPCGGKLTSFNLGHHDEVGFRLDWPGHSLAYVTDTIARPDAVYLEPIRGVDLLVHECNGPNRLAQMMTNIGHSYTAAVAEVAAQVEAKRLVLVHKCPVQEWSVDEDMESARVIFPAVEIGNDGMEIEF